MRNEDLLGIVEKSRARTITGRRWRLPERGPGHSNLLLDTVWDGLLYLLGAPTVLLELPGVRFFPRGISFRGRRVLRYRAIRKGRFGLVPYHPGWNLVFRVGREHFPVVPVEHEEEGFEFRDLILQVRNRIWFNFLWRTTFLCVLLLGSYLGGIYLLPETVKRSVVGIHVLTAYYLVQLSILKLVWDLMVRIGIIQGQGIDVETRTVTTFSDGTSRSSPWQYSHSGTLDVEIRPFRRFLRWAVPLSVILAFLGQFGVIDLGTGEVYKRVFSILEGLGYLSRP